MFNNPFLPNILIYILVLFCAYLSTYLIGRIVAAFMPELRNNTGITEGLFNRLVIGFVVLITLYAIYWTKGNSIFIIGFLLFGMYLFKRDYLDDKLFDFKRISLNEIWSVFLGISVFILFFILAYFLFYIRSGGEVWSDNVFYANLSHLLSVTHVESTNNMYDLNNNMASIYHFSDIWFTAFWTTLFNLSNIDVLHLVTYTYLYSLFFLGSFAICSKFLKSKFVIIILSITIFFIKPLFLILFPFIENYYVFSEIAFFPKLIVIDVLFLFSLLHFILGNKNLSFFSVLLLIPFYSSVSAGVLSGLFVLFIIAGYIKHGFSHKILFNFYILTILGVFTAFVLFYYLQGVIFNSSISIADPNDISSVKSNPVFWTVKFSIKRILGSFLSLLPSFLLFLYAYKNNKTKESSNFLWILLFIFIGVIFSSIISAIISNFFYDGYQISSNFSDTTISIFIFCTIIFLLSKVKNYAFTGSIAILLFCFYLGVFFYRGIPFTYPKSSNKLTSKEIQFYNKAKQEFSTANSTVFAYYRNYDYLEKNKNTYVQTMLFFPLSKLINILDNGSYLPYCLSVYDIPINNGNYDEREQTPFWRFVEKERITDNNVSINKCVEKFICTESIGFIVVEGDVQLPQYIIKNSNIIGELNGSSLYKINVSHDTTD